MRIVLLTTDLSGHSGWSRYAVDLKNALAKRGHEVHAITEQTFLRHPTGYLSSGLLRRWHAWRLEWLLRTINPDVVHVIAEPYALMLPLMHKSTWKTVLTIHGSYAVVPLHINASSRTLAEKYYRETDAIISVSQFTKSYLKEEEPALFADAHLDQRITVIHNAIDLEGIHVSDHNKDRAPLSILSVSAVKRKKGYLQSIEAIATFRKEHDVDLRYDIIGSLTDTAFKRELEAQIATYDLQDIVHLRSTVDDATLDEMYRNADLFLLPSLHDNDYFEGFGLVYLEANARGVPVIGSTTGGCREAIKEGITGYVCDPENTDQIAERMADILIKKTIKPAACRSWAEEHDMMKTVEKIEKVYLT